MKESQQEIAGARGRFVPVLLDRLVQTVQSFWIVNEEGLGGGGPRPIRWVAADDPINVQAWPLQLSHGTSQRCPFATLRAASATSGNGVRGVNGGPADPDLPAVEWGGHHARCFEVTASFGLRTRHQHQSFGRQADIGIRAWRFGGRYPRGKKAGREIADNVPAVRGLVVRSDKLLGAAKGRVGCDDRFTQPDVVRRERPVPMLEEPLHMRTELVDRVADTAHRGDVVGKICQQRCQTGFPFLLCRHSSGIRWTGPEARGYLTWKFRKYCPVQPSLQRRRRLIRRND